ncbi:MAG: 8-oxo-dGTP diphosphatase [Deinococcota bacterium]
MKLATLAYVRRNHNGTPQTLMLHKQRPDDYHQGKWNGLGGKFEAGESPEDCLIREVFEESGLTVVRASLRGFITFPDFDGQDDWYTFVYTIEETTGELRASAEGDLEWIDDNELLNLNLWEGDRIFIPWLYDDLSAELSEARVFSATFRYGTGGVFQDHDVVFYGQVAQATLPSAGVAATKLKL